MQLRATGGEALTQSCSHAPAGRSYFVFDAIWTAHSAVATLPLEINSRIMKLSEKFEEALIYSTRAHGNQTRKKTGIPFVAHILGVTAIALEYGANEIEAISALLHDTVEDTDTTFEELEREFGKVGLHSKNLQELTI